MELNALKNAVEIVKPALATVNVIPIFSHLCFDGKSVTAYNDIIGIQQNIETDIHGALHGPTVIGLLSNTKAKNIEVTTEKEQIKLKLGRSTANLAFLAEDDFVFELPKTDLMQTMGITEDFIHAMIHCMQSTGLDQTKPATMGVALKVNKGQGSLYSTNSEIIGKAVLSSKITKRMQNCDVIFSNEFCTNLIKLSLSHGLHTKTNEILFNKTEALAHLGPNTHIFGKLVNTDNTLDYDGVIKNTLKRISSKSNPYVPIPKSLESALKRALVILGPDQSSDILAKIEKGKLTLNSTGTENQIRDVLKIDKKHDKATSRMYPANLLKLLTDVDEIVFGKPCIALRQGKRRLYLCSNKV